MSEDEEQRSRTTNLPRRRQMEQPPPEKKPKWQKLLRAALQGILIWLPRSWRLIEIIYGWFVSPGL